jgi:hypothetical protein
VTPRDPWPRDGDLSPPRDLLEIPAVPIIVTNPPALVEVRGNANKATPSGDLNVSIVVTEGAGGWPPMPELQAALLELFSLTATAGWVGTLQLRYESGQTLHPDLPEPDPDPEPDPEPEPEPAAAQAPDESTES